MQGPAFSRSASSEARSPTPYSANPGLPSMKDFGYNLRERFKKKNWKKKLTNVSFMYVCVAGNGEMLVFFSFFPPTIV